MHATPVYPIVVQDKFSPEELFGFQTFGSVQEELEIVDVESGAYDAWDSRGRRLLLRPRPDVGHDTLLTELRAWFLSLLARKTQEPFTTTADEDDWLDVSVVSSETDPSLLPKLRTFLAANGRASSDRDDLPQLISHLPTISGL